MLYAGASAEHVASGGRDTSFSCAASPKTAVEHYWVLSGCK